MRWRAGRAGRAGQPPDELAELRVWCNNRGVDPADPAQLSDGYSEWVAARQLWAAEHGGWPHRSWETFQHDGSRHGAQGSAGIDEVWQRRAVRRGEL